MEALPPLFLGVHLAVAAGLIIASFVGGWVLARQALAARGSSDDYLQAKLATARFYCDQLLPQAAGLVPSVTAGKDELVSLTPDQLASS